MNTKTKWVIDPTHSEISFKVKHLMISNVKGVFNEFEGSLEIDGTDFNTADLHFSLNTASIDTGMADRDAHLKSPDFFDVEKYNTIKFVGTRYEKKDDENYAMLGDLTIKGITNEVRLDVEFGGVMKDPWGNEKAGFSINGKINRKDWNLNWNATLEAGGVLVSDEVRINCEVELVKQAS